MPQQVLIVEDNPDDSVLMTQIVGKMMNIEYQAVRNGALALEAAAEKNFNLILLDLNLPDTTGWDIATRLRRLPNYKHIPIIATSAFDRALSSLTSQAADCDVFLAKPIEIDKMIALVNRYLW